MREEVKVLEYHSHLLAELIDISLGRSDIFTFERDGAGGRTLQEIKRTKERRLT